MKEGIYHHILNIRAPVALGRPAIKIFTEIALFISTLDRTPLAA
jgi:hypothetical protein